VIPVELRTARLVLDQLGPADAPLVTTYCQDPLFERYLTTPATASRAGRSPDLVEPRRFVSIGRIAALSRQTARIVGV
jgi:hypothetical protein